MLFCRLRPAVHNRHPGSLAAGKQSHRSLNRIADFRHRPGSGGYAEQNHGAVNDPVPTPEAEQAESSEDGSRNSALKGSQAGADNAEARSSSLLWGGLTILVGLAVIVAAWLFL
ncbi:hypothetical protein CJ199_14620, partial [Brevibacterium paucivorans]